ncbi:MAG: arginase family protein [Vicinamibacteria bacterium]
MVVELVGVPFSSSGRRDGIAAAIGALRGRDLSDRLGRCAELRDSGDLELENQTSARAPGRLRNESGVVSLVEKTAAAVGAALSRRSLPLLVGGDCPVILGALAALKEHAGPPGLVMIDGHEDAYPPSISPTGEASDSELGMALGQFEDVLPEQVTRLTPLIAPERVALIGPRDRRELASYGVPSLADRVWLRSDEDLRGVGPEALAEQACAVAGRGSRPWWLHVDLDALTSEDFPAADYLQEGGLTWTELELLAERLLGDPGCSGCSVAIYNPDLDPGWLSAERIVAFLATVLGGGAVEVR